MEQNRTSGDNDEKNDLEFKNTLIDENQILSWIWVVSSLQLLMLYYQKILIPIISVLISLILLIIAFNFILYLPDLPDLMNNVITDKWYHVTPPNSYCSDGSQYYAPFKFGSNPKNFNYLVFLERV